MRVSPKITNARRAEALDALEKSDITIHRCFENGIPVPEEWKVYRSTLRGIVYAPQGSEDAAIPERPAYPEGT